MARVRWSRQALVQLDQITIYIQQFDLVAAAGQRRDLVDAAESLTIFPNRGRPAGRGFRERVVRPYIIRYKVTADVVGIVSIRHAAQLSQD